MKKWKLTTLLLAASVLSVACSSDQTKDEVASSSSEPATSSEVSSDKVSAGSYVLKQMYGAPHGDKSFSVTAVLMDGDTIVAAKLDEFQFVSADDFKGVPNSDGAFAENYPEGLVLSSKAENDDAYSAMMKEKGGATQKMSVSLAAITDYVAGKTVAELEAEIADNENMAEVVTGATLSDTTGYVKAIVDAAKDGTQTAGGKTVDGTIDLTLTYGAPHGDKSFSVTALAKAEDTIVAANIDEFQYVSGDDFTGVPNSDGAFAENYPEGLVLSSKAVNDDAYSAMMAEKGGATQKMSVSLAAITDYVTGKTVTEIETDMSANEDMVEVVTGATLSDTTGYVQAIVDAAK